MADPLSNASPVGGVGGFPSRTPHDLPKRQNRSPEEEEHSADAAGTDEVELHGASQVARRLLRERVLARTRENLELETAEFVPSFAEDVDKEPVGAFLGRLIGAQNQLAALRANNWSQDELRHALDLALRDGTSEVLELLANDDDHGAIGAQLVAQVLAEYAKRLALLTE